MIRILIIACLLLSVVSCGETEELPDGVMKRDKFVKVMIDMQVADARVSHLASQDMEEKAEHYPYYKEVFEKHDITRDEFNKSFDYYGTRQEEMFSIYEEVMDSIKLRKARLQPLLHTRPDSLQKE